MMPDEFKTILIRHIVAAVLLGYQSPSFIKAKWVDGWAMGEIVHAIVKLHNRKVDPTCEAVLQLLEQEADFAAPYVRPVFEPELERLTQEYSNRELAAWRIARLAVLMPLHQALVAEARTAMDRATQVAAMLEGAHA